MSETSVALRDFLDLWPTVPTVVAPEAAPVEGVYSITEEDENNTTTGRYRLMLISPVADGTTGIFSVVDSLIAHVISSPVLDLVTNDLHFKYGEVASHGGSNTHYQTHIELYYDLV